MDVLNIGSSIRDTTASAFTKNSWPNFSDGHIWSFAPHNENREIELVCVWRWEHMEVWNGI